MRCPDGAPDPSRGSQLLATPRASRAHALLALARRAATDCGGGIAPAGVLNRLRDYAYPLSQTAWSRRRDNGRRQALAEAQLRTLDDLQTARIEC